MRERRSLHLAGPSGSHWIPIWVQSTALLQHAGIAGHVAVAVARARERGQKVRNRGLHHATSIAIVMANNFAHI